MTLPKRIALLPLFAALVGLLLLGCGGGGGGSTSTEPTSGGSAQSEAGGGDAVKIADYAFDPGTISVAQGTTVVFSNEDETAHTATAKGSGAFDTGAIQPGKSAEVTLEEPGTYEYYCAFHPFMKGKIEVE